MISGILSILQQGKLLVKLLKNIERNSSKLKYFVINLNESIREDTI